MACAICELENVPETNTGICPECWEKLNTSDELNGENLEIEILKKAIKNR
mgnify:CR=1 FL=1